jgi:uncharacterized tellurite resistance protein B-like protein
MGIFDKLSKKQDLTLSPKAGMLLAAMTMIGIDGHIDDDEISIILRLDGSNKTDAFDQALKVYKMKTIEESVKLATQAMNKEQQLMTIANLIDIAMADGLLVGEEKTLLEIYVEKFDIDESNLSKIIYAISIKNDDSVF